MDANIRKRNAYPEDSSPLRETGGKKQKHTLQNEEEEYNRRRDEELRRHIMQKDADLNTLQKSSDFVRTNAGDPSTYDRSTTHFSFGGKAQAEREKSPFSLAPSSHPQDSLMYPTLDQQPPHHIKEHISNIQSDNTSLMRRLNLVIAELDRVQREKEEINQKLGQVQKGSNEIQKVINGEDNMDKVNRYMQDDLIYERDRNQKIKLQIKEEDLYKNQLLKELRKLDQSQEDQCEDNKGMNHDLQLKVGQIQDLEKEHYFTQEKIKAVNQNIDHLRRTLNIEGEEKTDLQMVLSQLISERNELLQRLDHLTYKYDECVKEISSDRADMEAHNKHHAKLITAKIIFQSLEAMQKIRARACFQEFKSYCQFDIKCHQRLSNFAKVLDNLGKFKQKIGLSTWFENSLKPLEQREQSFILAKKVNDNKIASKAFYQWRKAYSARIYCYDQKTRAVQAIWQRQIRDTQVERKRAFVIWRDKMLALRVKRAKVKKLIMSKYFKVLNLAMNAWLNHSSNIDGQVRLCLLSKQFSHKQYITLLFNSFRYKTTESKAKRRNILFHTLKAWQDYMRQKKFLMASGLLALQFQNQTAAALVKACFDAMRQHKEEEKFVRTHQVLHEEELPLIESLENETENMQVQNKFKQKTRACETVKAMLSKGLYMYFNKWRQVNEDYKEKCRTTLKDRIIKCYMETLRVNFATWKLAHNSNKVELHEMEVNELQSDQTVLTNEVIALKKDIKDQVEQRQGKQQKNLARCVQSYQKRMLELAMGRWRDKMTDINVKENGAAVVIRRLRMRLLRKAFDRYLAGVNTKKKDISDEARCILYQRTRKERVKQTVYDAWRIFKINHVRAKKYWKRIYLRLDLSMKQRALKKWQEGSQRRIEKQLEHEQNEITSKIEVLNHQLGEMHEEESKQQGKIGGTKDQLSKQAQKILANAFARFYYVANARMFEKWKEVVRSDKHKANLLRKFLDHWKKYQFYFVKAVFQNWILNANIIQRKEQVKKEEMKIDDTAFQFDQQTQLFSAMKFKLNKELDEITNLQRIYNDRLQKSVRMIVKKVDINYYMSRKRYILQQWREYVKREKNFIRCTQNVIQKSLWKKGFQEIKSRAREVEQQRVLKATLKKFRQKFWKRVCSNAFSVWRSGSFKITTTIMEEVIQETNQTVEDHSAKIVKMKEHNAVKSEKLICKSQLRNIWKTWVTVIRYLKLKRLSTVRHSQEKWNINVRAALLKWKSRKDATKMARLRVKRLKSQFKALQLKFYFNAMKKQFQNTRSIVKRLSNLANIQDLLGIRAGFNAIASFARAKEFVFNQRKANSVYATVSALQGLLMKRKHQHFIDLRLRCMNKRNQETHRAMTIIHTLSNRMRQLFNRWKAQSGLKQLAIELHEEGETREQIFEDQQKFTNVKAFMRNEGYDNNDIQTALDDQLSRQKCLMMKGVARMKHYNDELYAKPKMFDRWRQYVHMRKLFRYWLNFAHLKSDFYLSDASQCFNRWKNYYPKQFSSLMKLDKCALNRRFIKNSNGLDSIADEINDKENAIAHLADQREALVENYIKAQKLALSLLKFNMTKATHKAFIKWFNYAKMMKNLGKLAQLKRNLNMIADLKDKLTGYEQDNDALANENEELRQFSLDGYEIAKNVQALTTEREKLSVDLADKAQMIRKLLDENDKLTQRLRFAQDEAQEILRKTQGYPSASAKKSKSIYS